MSSLNVTNENNHTVNKREKGTKERNQRKKTKKTKKTKKMKEKEKERNEINSNVTRLESGGRQEVQKTVVRYLRLSESVSHSSQNQQIIKLRNTTPSKMQTLFKIKTT